MIEDYDFVVDAANKYFDAMPPRCSVTLPDLIHSVREMIDVYTPPPIKINDNQLYFVAQDIAKSRTDLVIMKEFVIYKLK